MKHWLVLTIDGSGDLDLVPHWAAHYSALLPTCKLVVRLVSGSVLPVYLPRNFREGWIDKISASECRGTPQEAEDVYAKLRCRGMNDDDWYTICDLDEFWTLPRPAADILRDLESVGLDVAYGHFVDRHAASGRLEAIKPDGSLFDQFSARSNFTRDVLRGGDGKVFACKGRHLIDLGHHFVRHVPWIEASGVYGGPLECNHFKWKAGLVDRLEKNLLSPLICDEWRREAKAILTIYGAWGRLPV